MTVSKTVGVGSNPAVPAKKFEIMIDWIKLFKCIGIVFGIIVGLVLICWGSTHYPVITSIVLLVLILVLSVMFLYCNI